jgi:rare lipoprotein A
LRIDSIAKASAVLAGCLAVAAPAPALADATGGLPFGSDTGGDSLVVRTTAMLNRTLHISGTLAGAASGEAVVVQRLLADGTWETVATTSAAADGSFNTVWRTNHIGRQALRAVEASSATATATAASVQATGRVTIYRSAVATYFGPGFYGKPTACGQKLTKTTLGVAHKTLPCGTLVDLYYKGRTITVPVVDRGPYRPNTAWDLTQATADQLGFTETGSIGAVRVASSS